MVELIGGNVSGGVRADTVGGEAEVDADDVRGGCWRAQLLNTSRATAGTARNRIPAEMVAVGTQTEPPIEHFVAKSDVKVRSD